VQWWTSGLQMLKCVMISDTESVAGCDVMQMESHNQELADENCSLRDDIERLR